MFGGGRKEFSESLTGTRKDMAVVFGKQTGQMEVVQASLSILQSPQPAIETRKTLSQFCGADISKLQPINSILSILAEYQWEVNSRTDMQKKVDKGGDITGSP